MPATVESLASGVLGEGLEPFGVLLGRQFTAGVPLIQHVSGRCRGAGRVVLPPVRLVAAPAVIGGGGDDQVADAGEN
ncbi:MAG: hypothetical protein L0H41_09620 [Microlunatus sp.]|jgi:hypothetical protein|nr:hypothetical protein [Microlunatus sp.]